MAEITEIPDNNSPKQDTNACTEEEEAENTSKDKAMEEPQPESDFDPTKMRKTRPGNKRLILTLSVLFSFLIGLPFLIKSVEIYRSPLPFRDIDSLSTVIESQPVLFPCQFQAVFVGFNSKYQDTNHAQKLGSSIASEMRRLAGDNLVCGTCGNNFSVSVAIDGEKGCVQNLDLTPECSWQCNSLMGLDLDVNVREDELFDEFLGSALLGRMWMTSLYFFDSELSFSTQRTAKPRGGERGRKGSVQLIQLLSKSKMVSAVLAAPWMRIKVSPAFGTPILRLSPLYDSRCYRHFRRSFSLSASSNTSPPASGDGQVRVRFAPSPTGNLHVGGARTALFNYLFARSKGGKFVLRIEDTDLERSTKESEDAVLRDLTWLGLDWDEGPGIGGDFGPYRQSDRNALYKQYAEKLLESGYVYRCFCTSEELEKMKEIAKLKGLPPVYTGKWATAAEEEVHQELEKGTPFTYRFRVPKEGSLKINDLIRGEVCWGLDTLGDFVIMRSNGQPVYNFCVTVDDATMAISHVIRAEEHLPNTLRQALIYKALGFPMPNFAHVSLILAPDRSKLSKRHGATSVGQFREMGYLPQAMVNYLALLGWGDGTENEFYTLQQLVEKFTIERVNKSGAIFDSTKLRWMNGQHLRSLPTDDLTKLIGEHWKSTNMLNDSGGQFVEEAVALLKDGIDLIPDSEKVLSNLLSYPLYDTLASAETKPVLEDNLRDIAASLLAAYDSGEITAALEEGPSGWQKWVKSFSKGIKRKGKGLFMPLRVLLTGKLHGPEMGSSIILLYKAGTLNMVHPQAGFITLDERFKMLREVDWESFTTVDSTLATPATTTAL